MINVAMWHHRLSQVSGSMILRMGKNLPSKSELRSWAEQLKRLVEDIEAEIEQ